MKGDTFFARSLNLSLVFSLRFLSSLFLSRSLSFSLDFSPSPLILIGLGLVLWEHVFQTVILDASFLCDMICNHHKASAKQ